MKMTASLRVLFTAGIIPILALSLAPSLRSTGLTSTGGDTNLYLPFIGRNYQGGLGSVSGTVTDARDGRPLDGINDEAQVCYLVTNCVETDSNGNYTISGLPSGARALTAKAQGYVNLTKLVQVAANSTIDQDYPLSPDDLSKDQYRIIVTWDDDPPDLDAHLWTPYLINGRPHVFQENRGDCDNPDPQQVTEACLDLDAVNGFGPETITILEAPPPGSAFFHYAVEKFEPCFPIACPTPIQFSNAVVRIYGQSGLLDTYTIPATGNPGNKRFWYVFTLEYDDFGFVALHTVNCFTDPPNPFDDPPTCPP